MVAVIPLVFGSLPKVTRARTSEDGQLVIVEDAAPAFVSKLGGGAASPSVTCSIASVWSK